MYIFFLKLSTCTNRRNFSAFQIYMLLFSTLNPSGPRWSFFFMKWSYKKKWNAKLRLGVKLNFMSSLMFYPLRHFILYNEIQMNFFFKKSIKMNYSRFDESHYKNDLKNFMNMVFNILVLIKSLLMWPYSLTELNWKCIDNSKILCSYKYHSSSSVHNLTLKTSTVFLEFCNFVERIIFILNNWQFFIIFCFKKTKRKKAL